MTLHGADVTGGVELHVPCERGAETTLGMKLLDHQKELQDFLARWNALQHELLETLVHSRSSALRLADANGSGADGDARLVPARPVLLTPAGGPSESNSSASRPAPKKIFCYLESEGRDALPEGRSGSKGCLCNGSVTLDLSTRADSTDVLKFLPAAASRAFDSEHTVVSPLRMSSTCELQGDEERNRMAAILQIDGREDAVCERPSQTLPRSYRQRAFRALQRMLRDPPEPRGPLAPLVGSKLFEFFSSFVILVNAVVIGYAGDYARTNLSAPSTVTLQRLETFFTLFYFVELLMRIWVYRIAYFVCPDWKWNILDTMLVIVGIQDQLSQLGGADGSQQVAFLRVVRLMKMMKLLRIIRLLRLFRELRLILNSILGSVKSMLWSILLIMIVTFIFGMFFLQAVTAHLQEFGAVLSTEELDTFDKHWGSVPQALNSMYLASMGGDDWRAIAEPLMELGTGFYVIFCIYIGFFNFVILNTLTSLFVENTIANADLDQERVIQEEMQKKWQYVEMLKNWYKQLDADGSGEISLDEFVKNLDNPEVDAFVSAMDIEITDVTSFFRILSNHGNRAVDLETFVVGCIKLKGVAKSMDLMDFMLCHKEFAIKSNSFQDACLKELRAIAAALPCLQDSLQRAGAVGDAGAADAQSI